MCQKSSFAYYCTKLLLESQPNDDARKEMVDSKNKEGRTALMEAVSKRNFDVINILMKAKPDLMLEDNNGRTAVVLANEIGLYNYFESIKTMNRYTLPVKERNINLLEILLSSCSGDSNVDDPIEPDHQDSPLTLLFNSKLVGSSRVDESSYSSQRDFFFTEIDIDSNCFSPFSLEEMRIMELLLEKGASIFKEGTHGAPLMMAVSIALKDKRSKLLSFLMKKAKCPDTDHEMEIYPFGIFADALVMAVETVKNHRHDAIRCMLTYIFKHDSLRPDFTYDEFYILEEHDFCAYSICFERAILKGCKECVKILIDVISDHTIVEYIDYHIIDNNGDYDMFWILKEELDWVKPSP